MNNDQWLSNRLRGDFAESIRHSMLMVELVCVAQIYFELTDILFLKPKHHF